MKQIPFVSHPDQHFTHKDYWKSLFPVAGELPIVRWRSPIKCFCHLCLPDESGPVGLVLLWAGHASLVGAAEKELGEFLTSPANEAISDLQTIH